MTEMSGQVAVVTGAARGIGRATAVKLAQRGADVVVSDLAAPIADLDYQTSDAGALAETVAAVEGTGRRCIQITGDVRVIDDQRKVVSAALEHFGRLDVVVANAGIAGWPKTTWEASQDEWDRMIGVTLTGTWNTCRAAIPAILEGGRGGSIVIVSSTAALKPIPTIGHYSAAKAGLVGLMKSLALELAAASIRVNTVHPGGTATPMTENDAAEHWQATATGVGGALELPLPIHRMEPVDIAEAICFLAEPRSRYITGTTLVVDAGALLK